MHLQRLLEHLLLVFSVAWFLWFAVFHMIDQQRPWEAGQLDFAVFYAAGSIVHPLSQHPGSDVYNNKVLRVIIDSVRYNDGGTVFFYPPPAALLFVPYASLPFETASWLWAATNAAALLIGIYLTVKILLQDRMSQWYYSFALFTLSFSDTVHKLFFSGQINGFLFALMIGAMAALVCHRSYLAGVLFATATVIKVFPVVFLPYLILKKQWSAILSFCITIIGWFLLATTRFGITGMERFFTVKLPKILQGEVGFLSDSTSLFGAAHTLIDIIPWVEFGLKRSQVFVALDIIFPFIAALGFTWLFYVLWQGKSTLYPRQIVLEYVLIIMTVLLFSKAIHTAFLLWLLPAVYFWTHQLQMISERRKFLVASLGLLAALFTQYHIAIIAVGDTMRVFLTTMVLYCFMGLVYWKSLRSGDKFIFK